MMPERIKSMLEKEQHPENIQKLLDHINRWLRGSRGDMGRKYTHWERNIQTYRGKVPKDADDWEARQLAEPERFIMPLSYAQVQTFVAFAFLLLTQNDPFYQLEANSDAYYGMEEYIEKLLKRDLLYNSWPSKLYQFLLDIARCGIGVFNCYWDRETQWVQLPAQANTQMFGPYSVGTAPVDTNVECIRYEGNKLVNVNPFRFLPDLRVPLSRWKDGQFAADEEEWHISQIKEFERKGLLVGSKYIHPFQRRVFETRGPGRFWRTVNSFAETEKDPSDFMCVLGQVQIKLVPKDYGLGHEDYPILMLVRLANDQRILSIEPAAYLHGEFTYHVAQLSPDNHLTINESVSDVINAIQDTVTWLINSRIASVRKSLDSHFIMDPTKFDMDTVRSRQPFIFIKKNMATIGIDKFFKQLEVRDTTQAHMQDADTLMKLMQFVTGINENAMGQFSGGRRSATEARAVNAGAASRMKIPVVMAWNDALGPMGRQMLVNQRQGMSYETFQKCIGPVQFVDQMFQWYCPQDPRALIGNNDYFVFDSTLQSEKGFLAQSLQELMMAAMQNPEVAPMFDFEKLVTEIQTLRGVNNVSRFIVPQYQRNPLAGPQPTITPGLPPNAVGGGPPGAPTQPGGVQGQPGLPSPSPAAR